MSPMTLSDAVKRLYFVFGKYGLNAPVKGCDHCVMPADIARIQAKPLRSLTAADLEKYAFKAMTTWGDERDFKHFLPRLFEISADELLHDGQEFDRETLFGKLNYAHWEKWPQDEQQAILEFFHELWKQALGGNCSAGNVLRCIAQSNIELKDFLEHWLHGSGNASIQKLVEFGTDVLEDLTKNRVIGGPYWNDRSRQAEEVSHWLLAESTLERLERFAVDHVDEMGSEQAMDLAGYLRALRVS